MGSSDNHEKIGVILEDLTPGSKYLLLDVHSLEFPYWKNGYFRSESKCLLSLIEVNIYSL